MNSNNNLNFIKMEEIILKTVREQERVLLSTRDNMIRRNIRPDDNRTYQFERAKLIGMLSVMDAMKIDRKEFNWIFY